MYKNREDRQYVLFGIYDTACAECCKGIFTASEAAKWLGVHLGSFYRGVRNNALFQRRYEVKRLGKDVLIDEIHS